MKLPTNNPTHFTNDTRKILGSDGNLANNPYDDAQQAAESILCFLADTNRKTPNKTLVRSVGSEISCSLCLFFVTFIRRQKVGIFVLLEIHHFTICVCIIKCRCSNFLVWGNFGKISVAKHFQIDWTIKSSKRKFLACVKQSSTLN